MKKKNAEVTSAMALRPREAAKALEAALLVAPSEAARLLAVSPRKLWSMTFGEKPGLPFVRCGRLVRYPVADLQRWIESQREGGSDDAS